MGGPSSEMTMKDLKAGFWVDALRWRAEGAGAHVYIEHKGDPDAGVVLLITVLQEGQAQLYAPMRNFEGERVWTCPLGDDPVPEQDVSAYARRRLDDDPDLWLVTVEDRYGRHFLNEPLEKF